MKMHIGIYIDKFSIYEIPIQSIQKSNQKPSVMSAYTHILLSVTLMSCYEMLLSANQIPYMYIFIYILECRFPFLETLE